ncbi:acyl-CoA dehydrogenase family protein [Nocardia sp. NPDC048505]|uniref:acyl-CoA dehydrogenase family protein n=1 Tax=Nocardia sp. NPDC048505 TaxID=3155756 RepID=UPI0033DF5415
MSAPRLLLILTGHFSLTISAITRLGNGSAYQQQALDELDSGKTIGVLMLTELGGTNGNDHQAVAEWDAGTEGFWITTRTAQAWKFMPNAASTIPKTAVVTARLLVEGADQGVLPFLVRLRTTPTRRRRVMLALMRAFAPKSEIARRLRVSTGLAPGLQAATLPPKSSAAMDHGLYRFTRVWVPRDALLGGDWAQITEDGRFVCEVPHHARFHRAIAVLGDGRLDLANAAIASARAGLAGLTGYSRQRRPGKGMVMAERDNVRLDLVSGIAAVYACSVLGRRIRDQRAASDSDDRVHALWAMLAKPLLSDTTLKILTACQQLAGAQGALRSNLISDWIGNTKAIITAEGANRILQVKAGQQPGLENLRLPGTPEDLPWYLDMLIARERRIADSLRNGVLDPASRADGPETAAVELAEATAQRLAATSLHLESMSTTEPTARRLAEAAAATFALECVHSHGAWFSAHPDLERVGHELRRNRAILADHLPTLCAGFDLPDLQFAPIFSADYLRWYEDFAGWTS